MLVMVWVMKYASMVASSTVDLLDGDDSAYAYFQVYQ